MTHEEFDAACRVADAGMKARNGHSFVTILKTRCQYCGKSKAQAEGKRCGGWFQTFIDELRHELGAGL